MTISFFRQLNGDQFTRTRTRVAYYNSSPDSYRTVLTSLCQQSICYCQIGGTRDGRQSRYPAGTEPTGTAATASHSGVVRRLNQLLEEHENQPLHLVEICAATGISERTLRSHCSEHLGMGPVRYLHLRRMYLARAALLGADPAAKTVTGIACDYGFWELGRFSVAYRRLFGESPSATLRRPRNKRPVMPRHRFELQPAGSGGSASSPGIR